jgi:Spy/CpxP family protein refolding chaperone
MPALKWSQLQGTSFQPVEAPGAFGRFTSPLTGAIMKSTTKIIIAAAATVSLAVAGAVYAHPGMGMGPGMAGSQGMGPGMGMGDGMGMGPGMGMRGMGPGAGAGAGSHFDMAAAATARAAQLKSQLKITPEQEQAWKAYETLVAQQAASMQAMRDQFHAQVQNAQPGAGATDFAAHRQSMIALREANQAAHGAALNDLYAVLTPEQRAIANRNLSWGPQRMQGRLAPR